MSKWIYVDTRTAAIAPLLDGCLHILPSDTYYKHVLAMSCWCDARVVWSEEAGTCIISHRRRSRHKETLCA